MPRKAFLVQVDLEIQAVTCPGVWLCSNGRVSMQIYMLDSCIQTSSYKPVFPIKCKERFVFSKTFAAKHRLNDLQKQLHNQWIYVELVQWQNCEIGNVLATFQTTLDELLFPSSYNAEGSGVDLDLLMEPTKIFPGSIAPKIELGTKTTIEETICNCERDINANSAINLNPKVLLSSAPKCRLNCPRKVCHSLAYSQRKLPCKPMQKPPFRYRKCDDDLLLRKPDALEPNMDQCRTRPRFPERTLLCGPRARCGRKKPTQAVPMECPVSVKMCPCGSGNRENYCSVCAKYQGYFNTGQSGSYSSPQKKNSLVRPNLYTGTTKKFAAPHENLNRTKSSCTCQSWVVSLKNYDEAEKRVCFCKEDLAAKRPSLAEKLHARLASTLNSMSCTDYDENSDDLCDCDMNQFYGDLYQKTSNKIEEYCQCVPNRNSKENNNENPNYYSS